MELIKTKQSQRYPALFVKKYNRKVFYNNLWHLDPNLVESRGHVVDSQGKLVVNPPTKVFNYLENGTTIDPNEECLVVDKINGFMACLTYNKDLDEVLVSTTGSLDSDYCDMARDYLSYAIKQVKEIKYKFTLFFEVCHHNDPHIIPENIGAYLLGIRGLQDSGPYKTTLRNQKDLDLFASIMRVSRPRWYMCKFSQILENIKTCKHEGYMVYGLDSGTVLKLKSPYYLALKAIARKADILTLNKTRVDEEYYPLLNHLKELGAEFSQLDEQSKLTYIRNYLETIYV